MRGHVAAIRDETVVGRSVFSTTLKAGDFYLRIEMFRA
jgi:hypothetical protein